ncbi:MAG: hypothetical protein QOG16_136 [Actinomycetota bacterium]|jgi:hypothetical protein|nr:hypothetical protein [Actinomycetota bacterium]
MDMDHKSGSSSSRPAALAQAALAALVAGSLLAFSTIAFRSAFDDPDRGRGVTASGPPTSNARPVVLPDMTPAAPPKTASVPTPQEEIVAAQVAPPAPSSTSNLQGTNAAKAPARQVRQHDGFRLPKKGAVADTLRDGGGSRDDQKDKHEGKEKSHGKDKSDHHGWKHDDHDKKKHDHKDEAHHESRGDHGGKHKGHGTHKGHGKGRKGFERFFASRRNKNN